MAPGAIEWDDLRYVLAVAESGSLAAAARALGVNHTTVLRRVTGFRSGSVCASSNACPPATL